MVIGKQAKSYIEALKDDKKKLDGLKNTQRVELKNLENLKEKQEQEFEFERAEAIETKKKALEQLAPVIEEKEAEYQENHRLTQRNFRQTVKIDRKRLVENNNSIKKAIAEVEEAKKKFEEANDYLQKVADEVYYEYLKELNEIGNDEVGLDTADINGNEMLIKPL